MKYLAFILVVCTSCSQVFNDLNDHLDIHSGDNHCCSYTIEGDEAHCVKTSERDCAECQELCDQFNFGGSVVVENNQDSMKVCCSMYYTDSTLRGHCSTPYDQDCKECFSYCDQLYLKP